MSDNRPASGTRWRLMMFMRPIGPWRDSREEANQDAIDSGNADRDEYSGITYIRVPAWLQRQELR